jgi:antitoxin component YwqK of YwqJK toxin-antitoxin module
MKRFLGLALIMLFWAKAPVQAQFLKGIIINRYDRNAMHHGKWKYLDRSHGRRLICYGRFDHGKQVNDWKYFYPSGKLRMEESYTWEGDKRLVDVTFYHENGQVSNKGLARVEVQNDKTHYYWFGDWVYFDPEGTFEKTVTYNNGQPTQYIYPDGRVEIVPQKLPSTTVEFRGR